MKQQETRPLTEVISLDAQRKSALNKEFGRFYKLMRERMTASPEMKDLEVPLERVKDAVQIAAFGLRFGIPMVTVEEPEDWDE